MGSAVSRGDAVTSLGVGLSQDKPACEQPTTAGLQRARSFAKLLGARGSREKMPSNDAPHKNARLIVL